MYSWKLYDSEKCDCGKEQIMNHILQQCPRRRYGGELNNIFDTTKEAVDWTKNLDLEI